MVDRREFLAGVLCTSGLVAVKGNEQVIPLVECKKLAAEGKLTANIQFAVTRSVISRICVTANLMRGLKLARGSR